MAGLFGGIFGGYAGLPESDIPPPPEFLALFLWSLTRLQVERFSSVVGIPFRITSTYRAPDKNAAVGGAQNSAHVHGLAVDVVPDDWSKARALAAAWERETGGFALVESDHVHLNLPRSWGWSVIRALALVVALSVVLLTLFLLGVLDGKGKRKVGRITA